MSRYVTATATIVYQHCRKEINAQNRGDSKNSKEYFKLKISVDTKTSREHYKLKISVDTTEFHYSSKKREQS